MSLEQYKDASRKELWDILQIQMQVLQAETAKVAELEKERDELKKENISLQAYAFRVIAFVTRTVEKLRGIPEFKPSGDVLNRVLRLTPKIALEAHNLEQREESVANFCCWLIDNGEPIPEEQIQKYGSDYIMWVRNQAKTLKEQVK